MDLNLHGMSIKELEKLSSMIDDLISNDFYDKISNIEEQLEIASRGSWYSDGLSEINNCLNEFITSAVELKKYIDGFPQYWYEYPVTECDESEILQDGNVYISYLAHDDALIPDEIINMLKPYATQYSKKFIKGLFPSQLSYEVSLLIEEFNKNSDLNGGEIEEWA